MAAPTNAMTQTAPPPIESILQRLEQIEAAIAEAHNHCDQMSPRDGDSGAEQPTSGGQDVASRCQDALIRLNSRLVEIAASVGRI